MKKIFTLSSGHNIGTVKPGHRIRSLLYLVVVGVVSTLFLLIFSSYTSPLYPGYSGWDSGFFMYTGREIARGRIPYVDFFDMKGPIIFFINALGILIHDGRFGVFLVQIPFMYISVLFMYKTARLFVSQTGAAISVLFSLLYLSVTFGRGNLTEEYSLPFIIVCVYTACRFFKDNTKFSLLYGYVFGLSTAFIAFLRINNAAMIGAAALYVSIMMILKKDYKRFMLTTIAFIVGALTIVIPIFIYFSVHHALGDMFYGTFVIPSLYAEKGISIRSAYSWIVTLKRAMPAFFALAISVAYWNMKDKHIGRMMCLSSSLTLVAVMFGFNYFHYYTLTIPAFLVGTAMLLQLLKADLKDIRLLPGIFLAIALLINTSGFIHYLDFMEAEYTQLLDRYLTHSHLAINNEYINQAAAIPKKDTDSVLAYQVPSSWYFITGLSASNRYCAFQETFIYLDNTIKDEMVEMFENDPPKWIAAPVPKAAAGYQITFPELNTLLKTRYELVSSTTHINLYRYNLDE